MLNASQAITVLKHLLSEGKLSIFAGSGISVDSGLPEWDGFIDKYIEICEILNKCLPDSLKFIDIVEDAKKTKGTNLLGAVSALKNKIRECNKKGINTDFCDDMLNKLFYGAAPNEYHKHIVNTNYRHIITTNYDNLLEEAAEIDNHLQLLTHSYSYTDQQNLSIAIYSGETAIIHAHGKIADIKLDQFVLTKDDYLSIMRHNPGFRLIINSVFLTTSVLFVGYGGSDPHFEEIISDLNMTLNWDSEGDELPRCYIMLRNDKISPIRKFLNDKIRVEVISFNDYDEMKQFLADLEKEFPRP